MLVTNCYLLRIETCKSIAILIPVEDMEDMVSNIINATVILIPNLGIGHAPIITYITNITICYIDKKK